MPALKQEQCFFEEETLELLTCARLEIVGAEFDKVIHHNPCGK